MEEIFGSISCTIMNEPFLPKKIVYQKLPSLQNLKQLAEGSIFQPAIRFFKIQYSEGAKKIGSFYDYNRVNKCRSIYKKLFSYG